MTVQALREMDHEVLDIRGILDELDLIMPEMSGKIPIFGMLWISKKEVIKKLATGLSKGKNGTVAAKEDVLRAKEKLGADRLIYPWYISPVSMTIEKW